MGKKHTNFNDNFRNKQREKATLQAKHKKQDLITAWKLAEKNSTLLPKNTNLFKPRGSQDSSKYIEKIIEKAIDSLPISKRKREKQKRVLNKRAELSRQFPTIENSKYSDSRIDSITWKQINEGIKSSDVPWFFPFDFNHIYHTKHYFMFAYNDYMLERDFGELILEQSKKSDKQLLKDLKHVVTMTDTAIPSMKGTSSGQAGGAFIEYCDTKEIKSHVDRLNKWTEITKKNVATFDSIKPHTFRYHTKDNIGWQYVSSKEGIAFNKVTPHNLLSVCNAIMFHTTEEERWDFYTKFYRIVSEAIPEFLPYLPKMTKR